MREIKLYKSRWKGLKLLLLSSIFVLLGIHFITGKNSGIFVGFFSVICISFFGIGIPLSLFTLFDWRPQIVINEIGILDRSILKDFINWDLIEDAYLVDSGEKFICVVLKDGTDLAKYQTRYFKKMSALNKTFGFQELNINLAFVKIDEKRLTDFIIRMSKANKETRSSLLLSWN